MKIKGIKKFVLRKEFLILFIIIVLGSILRLQGTITNPFAYTYDVGRDMLALWDITHFIDFPFIGPTTGLPGVFYGPWWYYMLAPFFFLSGGNPAGIALVMNLVGIATIILSYFFGRKIGGELAGLSFAAVIAVSPIMISLSSQIWNPNIAPLFVLLTLYILEGINTSKKSNKLMFFFFGILIAMSADIEVVYGALFSMGILVAEILIRRFKFKVNEIIFFVLGLLLVLSPRILFEVKNNFLMTKSFFAYFLNGGEGKLNLFTAIPNRLDIFWGEVSSTLTGGNKMIGATLITLVIICIGAFYKKASDIEKRLIKTSFVVLAVFLVGASFFNHEIWPHYLVGLPIFYVLLFVISLNFLKNRFNIVVPLVILAVVFFTNFNPIKFVNDLREPLWEGDASVYRNQLAVVDYIYNDANGRKFKYVVYTPPVHDYTYEYLFKWYGPASYGYQPSNQSDLAYFIIEPDPEDPNRVEKWLLERSGDGKIIDSNVVKGGITVETRVQK